MHMTQPNNEKNHKGDVLLIDDTPENLMVLSRMLNKYGYMVRTAMNGPVGLQAVQTALPDIILLDISMPDMDGYEVCERLKADERTQDVPVIFISALDDLSDKLRAFQVGGVDYITKPFQLQEVLARLKNQLTIRRLQQQLTETNSILEQRVQERTTELAQANADLVRLNNIYERFVPREFLHLLHKEHITQVKLGDQVQQEMTIMFADIRSFTTLSEQMQPQENFNFLNSYLSRVSPCIRNNHGFIDKYIGDAIMALFPRQPEDALQAALNMLNEIVTYNKHRKNHGYIPINIGIGLHTGMLALGIIGEQERMQSTVIADTVNIAARLESLTKIYNASIIISEQMLFKLERPSRYISRFLGKVRVVGKQEPITIFEILDGHPEAVAALRVQTLSDFEKGLLHYYSEEFGEALHYFEHVLSMDPDDRAALLYSRWSRYYAAHGVPSDWSGVEMFVEK
jgi:two-component system sensor histidine kinase ChiS